LGKKNGNLRGGTVAERFVRRDGGLKRRSWAKKLKNKDEMAGRETGLSETEAVNSE